MLYTFVIVLTVIISILLIGIVLIQKSKGGGLSSQFGNASSVMGVRQTNTFLEKTTWTLAAVIVVLSIVSAYTTPSGTVADIRTSQEQPVLPGANQYDSSAQPVEAAPAAAQETAPAAEAATEAPAEAE